MILAFFIIILLVFIICNMPVKTLEQKLENFVKQSDIKCAQFRAGTMGITSIVQDFGSKEYKVWNKTVSCLPDNNTLFRIASVSKTITAAAILGMISRGLFALDTKLVDIIKILQPYDDRVNKITIRDLLRHSAGWDTSLGISSTSSTKHLFPETVETLAPFDPQYDSMRFLGDVTNTSIIYFMMQFSLNYDPGTKYVYSNFGYNILGRIIENVSGLTYEDYILKNVLNHAKNTAFIGRTDISKKNPLEVYYFDGPQDDVQFTWNCDIKYKVPSSYGTFDLKVMDSHGGWVMRISDLKIFGDRLLNFDYFGQDMLKEILKIPPYVGINNKEFYSLGMRVIQNDVSNSTILTHNGALTSGTFAVLSMNIQSKFVTAFVANHLPVNIGETMTKYQKIILDDQSYIKK